MSDSLRMRARATLDQLRRELLDERTDGGHWTGTLSPSALSTATAISAMSAVLISAGDSSASCSHSDLRDCIAKGIVYLRRQQNADGGFGDTDRSLSNIATSYLVLAASTLANRAIDESLCSDALQRLNTYIDTSGSIDALRQRYGTDKTFVVPILTNMAIAGLVSWDEVSALPFEAAIFPQSMYRLLQMPVVSYAIPALVAIGQARHYHGRKAFFPLKWIRSASISRTMKVLRRMQPESGGYLEATPLTSFVVMSLAATDRGDHEVSQHGLRFLVESMNADGSWPIDTNLATWVTSLSIHALACDPEDDGSWCREPLIDWHLGCQHRQRHPFTGAEPGGWGWSDLSGAVPDSDDTPAAILALAQAIPRITDTELQQRCAEAMAQGCDWLGRLQNRDGGWPTFCRGWGKLPFDRSSNDLTSHALRAFKCWQLGNESVPHERGTRDWSKERARAVRFLVRNQEADGSWLPLWFGNQDLPGECNPIYGTSRVLIAAASGFLPTDSERRGCDYLVALQNQDGGWGGGPSVSAWLKRDPSLSVEVTDTAATSPAATDTEVTSSVEETALVVDALASVLLSKRNLSPETGVETACATGTTPSGEMKFDVSLSGGGNDACGEAIIRGIEFLLRSVADKRHRDPWPIGFYFAKLWYHERLYPLIFTITALGKYLRATANKIDPQWPR